MTERLQLAVRSQLNGLQRKLNFEQFENPTFSEKMGVGRVAWIGSVLGFGWGFSLTMGWYVWQFTCMDQENDVVSPRLVLLWQFFAYFFCLCTFHLLEFFVTAFYNPTQVSADSFLINHSTAYTAAALSSWTEFGLHISLYPRQFNLSSVSYCGLALTLIAQLVRSLAMATAGESFNHLIQRSKKPNHKLITHGVYRYLRHPSYVGFYYWCIGCQLLLANYCHALLFSIVAWHFFARRIAYEEESLCLFFPDDYPRYVARTYSGIPFLTTKVDWSTLKVKKTQ